jgi:hypothetical protein
MPSTPTVPTSSTATRYGAVESAGPSDILSSHPTLRAHPRGAGIRTSPLLALRGWPYHGIRFLTAGPNLTAIAAASRAYIAQRNPRSGS